MCLHKAYSASEDMYMYCIMYREQIIKRRLKHFVSYSSACITGKFQINQFSYLSCIIICTMAVMLHTKIPFLGGKDLELI